MYSNLVFCFCPVLWCLFYELLLLLFLFLTCHSSIHESRWWSPIFLFFIIWYNPFSLSLCSRKKKKNINYHCHCEMFAWWLKNIKEMFLSEWKNLLFFDIAFIDYLLTKFSTDLSVKKTVHISDLQTRLDIWN